jgi:hypothetical protein
MLDADAAKITRVGEIIITKSGVLVRGFAGEGCSCRDVAALAAVWGIGRLQDELGKTLQKPGGGKICIE